LPIGFTCGGRERENRSRLSSHRVTSLLRGGKVAWGDGEHFKQARPVQGPRATESRIETGKRNIEGLNRTNGGEQGPPWRQARVRWTVRLKRAARVRSAGRYASAIEALGTIAPGADCFG